MNKTGIVRDMRYLDHVMGAYHPESPQRLKAIYEMLESPGMKGTFKDIRARMAEREELLMVHSPDYIDILEASDGISSTYLDPDTQTSAGSYKAALLAAGGLCEAISKVYSGELENAFALIRPPGHHAEKARAMGFCIFNNVAVGVAHALAHHGLKRRAIAGFDVSHGHGTEDIFHDDPRGMLCAT